MMDYNLRDGRTYMYFKGKPLYPFGYGLSYTTFEYSNLKASASQLATDGEVSIALDVRNAGSRAGDEVVQMYVTHVGSKVPREQEELKGFQRVSLAAGKKTSVRFTLKAADLAYWNPDRAAWEVEPDGVEVRIGSSSADIKLRTSLKVRSAGE
jgi:beta-glucosidase